MRRRHRLGKGVGAAIASTVRAALRIALPTGGALESLARVSTVVQADLSNNEAFVTMFHARLRSVSGELMVMDAGQGSRCWFAPMAPWSRCRRRICPSACSPVRSGR